MIYIKIPEGMEFKQLALDNTETKRDYFVDPEGKKEPLDIQKAVKSILQHVNKATIKQTTPESPLEIYSRVPPNDLEMYLKYLPNRNGKEATMETPEAVQGVFAQKYNPANQTRNGEIWYRFYAFSTERQKQILEQRHEQRLNRQHIGDCPKPT
ncbi:MAG: permease [Legionella sp.]|nr:permease [Legionella sp.]